MIRQRAESGTNDSTETQSTESALDSSAESYPADAEKVADKRESITVLLMRVDAEGCTIQGSHDYVSNMFADFGLINVNPGYEEVRVTLPKEDAESDSAAKVEEIQEADSQPAEGTEADNTAESEAAANSQTAGGTELDSTTEAEVTVDSPETNVEEVDSSVDVDAQTADSQATDGQVTDSKAAGSEEAADQAKVRPANEIEFENILSRNPDYIFVIYEGKEKTAEKTYKEICESREFWGNMTAVRNRHVYTLPQSTFAYPPNDQWDLAYEYLYQMMFVM